MSTDTVEDQVHNDNEEVHYLQSQNGNLFCSTSTQESEFVDFLGDIPKDLSWCTEALGTLSRLINKN